MKLTHFEKVIECFENMDAQMLEVCMESMNDVQSVKPAVFLKK